MQRIRTSQLPSITTRSTRNLFSFVSPELAFKAQAVAEHFKVPHLSLPEEVGAADLDKTILFCSY